MAYTLMKRIITTGKDNGTIDVFETKAKLETFLAFGSITQEQFAELMGMLE